ncbi:MAG: hypothetical protein ACYCO0_01585 [Candidatus Micrarchaeaceae archaeon]
MAYINRFYLMVLVFAGMIAIQFVTAQASTAISSSLCGIIGSIRSVVGILALALFILGGALYAVAHMLPAAGNLKGNLQGWSLGMIVGGIVGLIIVIIAPSLIGMIASAGGSSITPPTCP